MGLYHSAVSDLLTLQIKSADFKGKLNEFKTKIFLSPRAQNYSSSESIVTGLLCEALSNKRGRGGQGIIGNECRDRESIAAFDNGPQKRTKMGSSFCRLFLCSFDRIFKWNKFRRLNWTIQWGRNESIYLKNEFIFK